MPRVDPPLDAVRATAESFVAKHRLPGLGVAIVRSDGPVFCEPFGHADIESGERLRLDHRHRIGSVTKTMVALCAMSLVERGKLALDDLVRELLPDIRLNAYSDELRLWHLLTHTCGIGEAPTRGELLQAQEALWAEQGAAIPTVAEQYAEHGIDLEWQPGTRWCYANHGWVLVGEIVARTEGASIADVVARRVFEPLGMAHSDLLDQPHPDLTTPYHVAPDADAREFAKRYGDESPEEETVDGKNIRGRYQHVKGVSAGAVQCTLPDLARYAQALLRKSEGIVRPETFAQMTELQYCPDARLQHIGVSFFREDCFGYLSLGHNGGVLGGWNTVLKVIPELDLGIVLHLNASSDAFGEAEWLFPRIAIGASEPARTSAAPSGWCSATWSSSPTPPAQARTASSRRPRACKRSADSRISSGPASSRPTCASAGRNR